MSEKNRALLGLAHDLGKAHGGVFVEPEHRVVDQRDSGPAVLADPDGIPLAHVGVERGALPGGCAGALHFDGTVERNELPDPYRARLRMQGIGPGNRIDCDHHARTKPPTLHHAPQFAFRIPEDLRHLTDRIFV